MPICKLKDARPVVPEIMEQVENIKRNNNGDAAKARALLKRKAEKAKVKAKKEKEKERPTKKVEARK